VVSAFRAQGVQPDRALPTNSTVHIARADSYDADLAGILQKQYEHFRATVPLKDKRVVLKPNLVEWHRDKVINTHPQVVSAVIELCKREGAAEIIVAEGRDTGAMSIPRRRERPGGSAQAAQCGVRRHQSR